MKDDGENAWMFDYDAMQDDHKEQSIPPLQEIEQNHNQINSNSEDKWVFLFISQSKFF